MRTLMEQLKMEEDKLDLQQENSHGEYEKMKAVFEKRNQLYKRFLKEESLTDLERLMLSNKKEWQMSHLLGLIEHEDTINKLSDLTERVYHLEQQQLAFVARLEEE
jgi:hypothetical protein